MTFDNLNRATLKDLPGAEPDVTYAYDALSRLTSASHTGNALSFTYDALGRNLTQAGPQGTVSSQWDVAGRRTKLTYPGSGLFIDYDYLVTDEMTKARENGATTGVGVLATYSYDDLGRRTGVTFGNGAAQAFAYDPVSRLASLTNNLSGTVNDLSATFAYNPASQIASTVRTGDAYAWTGHFNENKVGTANGLNQLTSVGAKTLTHDSKGNVTAFGTKVFGYSSENLLTTGPNSTTLSYDPLMRLHQTVSGATTSRFAYDGLDRIAEYDAANALLRRYAHGPGDDEPIVWYEGSGTTDRRFLGSDERGSIISVTDSAGALLGLNRYDEYGQPQSTNLGAFGYTGQAWLPTVGVWYYKARVYDSELGRFLQTDPIEYEGGANLYAYVGNDPVNMVDPLGLTACQRTEACVYGFLPRREDGLRRAGDTIGFNTGGPGGVTVPRQNNDSVSCDPSNCDTVTGTRTRTKKKQSGPQNETRDTICTAVFVLDVTGKAADGVALSALAASAAAARSGNPYLAGFFAQVAGRAFLVSRVTASISVPLNLVTRNYAGAVGNLFGATFGKTAGSAVETATRSLVGKVPSTRFGKELINTTIINAVGSVGDCK